MIASIAAQISRVLGGVRVHWTGCPPDTRQRIYFANHSSHLDFLALWSALPPEARRLVLPVAGGDYWERGPLRDFVIKHVFRAALVERGRACRRNNPLPCLTRELARGRSLVIFPEGTRGSGLAVAPFKSGLYHLAARRPDVELMPAYLGNLNCVLPKGTILPVPLPTSVTFGPPMRLEQGETRRKFLARAREALCSLRLQSAAI